MGMVLNPIILPSFSPRPGDGLFPVISQKRIWDILVPEKLIWDITHIYGAIFQDLQRINKNSGMHFQRVGGLQQTFPGRHDLLIGPVSLELD